MTHPRHPRRASAVILATILLLLLGVDRASGQTIIYVNAAAPAGGNGQSWATAYSSLDLGLDHAAAVATPGAPAQVWVARGTYVPTRRLDASDPRSATFTIPPSVSVMGGFVGDESSSEGRGIRDNPTFLSGDIAGNDSPTSLAGNGENCYRVVQFVSAGAQATLDGLFIRGGNSNVFPSPGPVNTKEGAGVFVFQGTLNIYNCDIYLNYAREGAAITVGGPPGLIASANIIGTIIRDNTAEFGSAMSDGLSSTTVLRNCTLAGNTALTGLVGQKAVFYKYAGSNLRVYNSIVWGNVPSLEVVSPGAATHISFCILPGPVNAVTASDNLEVDPQFRTVFGSAYFPSLDSPAVDSGLNAEAGNVGTDASGRERIIDGDRDGAGTVDRGAFEAQSIAYVNPNLTSGSNNGSSWSNAYRGQSGLATALSVARVNPGYAREIWIARGVSRPAPPGGPRDASFVLIDEVSVIGGFVGTEGSLAQRPPSPTTAADALDPTKATILSGDLNGNDNGDLNRDDNVERVVLAQGVGTSTVLDGVTIAAGGGDNLMNEGAGAFIRDASPTFRSCFFIDCRSFFDGGAVSIRRNTGTSAPRFENCTFERNRSGLRGGAVHLSQTSATFRDCVFRSNTAIGDGGAIAASSASVDAVRCTFVANSGVQGGAVFATSPAGTSPVPVFTAVNCLFLGNTSPSGGAVLSSFSSFTAVGSTFVGNLSQDNPGGAIYQRTGVCRLTNCTIVGNRTNSPSTNAGGGVMIDANSSTNGDALLMADNCVFWANSAAGTVSTEEAQLDRRTAAGFTTTVSVNSTTLEGWSGGYGGLNNNAADPLLLALPSAGGDGVLGTADDSFGDLRLAFGSPCIDSGDSLIFTAANGLVDPFDLDADGDVLEAHPLDLVGLPRFVEDPAVANTGVGTPPVDRGAYEAQVNCLACPGVREWRSAIGGVWDFPSNWTPSVPNSTHDTLFNLNSTYTVSMPPSIPAANLSANSALFRQGSVALNLSGGTLNLLDIDDPSLIVGDAAGSTAQLSLTSSTLAAVDVRVGSQPGSLGVLNVGPGSLLNTSRSLTVGFQGSGVLSVSGGGRVFTRDATVGDQATSAGYAQVAGAGSRWDVPFFLIINNGEVNVRDGATLTAGFGVYLFNDGVITGNGTINASVVNFGRVQPGNSPGTLTINGSYQQIGAIPGLGDTAGGLVSEIAGRTPGTFDTIQINGQATLGGGLYVAVDPAFTPSPTDTFDLVSATTGITRPFDVIFFQGLSGSNASRRLKAAYSGLRGTGTGRVRVGLDPLPINPGFAPPLAFTLPASLGPDSGVATGDLTGDGVIDAVIALPAPSGSGPGSVAILPGLRPPGQPWQGFGSPINLPVGARPAGVTIGDLDGDGRADLLVANAGSNTVSFLRQNPAPAAPGSFAPAVSFPTGSLPASVEPVSIALGDFDRDALIDLAVANRGGLLENGTIAILRNTGFAGSPAFAAAGRREIPTPPGRKPVIVNPFNPDNDKDVDLAVSVSSASGDAGEILVLINGSGASGGLPRLLDLTGPSLRLPMPAGASALASARLLPGSSLVRPDLVAISPADNSVCVLLNTTTPGVGSDASVSFAPFVSYPLGGEASPIPGTGAARGLALVDMDGDSDSDLAVLVADDAGAARSVLVLRNDSTLAAGVNPAQIAFALLPQVFDAAPAGAAPVALVSDDVDADARRDLLTAAASAGSPGALAVLRNTLPPPALSLGACCRGASCVQIPIGDCTGPRDVFTILGQACNAPGDPRSPCCRADFNKLSGVTIDDIFIYLNFWFASDPSCDVDGAGTVTIDDIFIYLNAWFAGC